MLGESRKAIKKSSPPLQQACASHQSTSVLESAPTCYRAPKRPDPDFPRKIPKKYPFGGEILDSRNLPENTPKNTKKYPQNTRNARFGYFFGILGVFFGGSRIPPPGGGFFRYFWWKFRVGPFGGSVAGRRVLNSVRLSPGVLSCCSPHRSLYRSVSYSFLVFLPSFSLLSLSRSLLFFFSSSLSVFSSDGGVRVKSGDHARERCENSFRG